MGLLKPCQGPGCEAVMVVRPALRERKKYCSIECRNRAHRGQRRSPATEFKPGNRPTTWVPVGTERVRDGVVYVKVRNPSAWRRRSVLVWRRVHGRPPPKGWVIVHLDGDGLNDDPSNLQAMPRSGHLAHTRARPGVEARRLTILRSPQIVARANRARADRRMARFDSFYWEAEVE